MIEINLIPPEMKKREAPFANLKLSGLQLKNLPLLNIIIVIAAAVVALQLALFIIGIAGTMRLNALTVKYDKLVPEKKMADVLKSKVDDINKRSAAIDELMARRFDWAKKINTVSDSVTPGIWLTGLSYDEKPTGRARAKGTQTGKGDAAPARISMPGILVMTGYASGAGEQGASLVGRFIKSLKDNSSFYADFSEIELVSVKTDKVDTQETMSFSINCFFK